MKNKLLDKIALLIEKENSFNLLNETLPIEEIIGELKVSYKNNIIKITIAKDKIAKEDLSWVKDYREMFKKVNPERVGDLKICKKKILKLISEYKITKDQILKATERYLEYEIQKNNGIYIVTSQYFISHQEKGNLILNYLEEKPEKILFNKNV